METIVKRTLGRSGIEVSAIGMGCWAIGGPFWSGDRPLGWGTVDDDESIRAIHQAIDLGITFFDTADSYGAGHSERILGKALGERRDQVVIATKFGNRFDEETKQSVGQGFTPDYIRSACEGSLRRLGTDHLDLLQFHINDFPPTDAEPIRDTLEELTDEGKIRAYGWSTDFADRAKVFARGPHCSTIQFQNNVMEPNTELMDLCEKENLAGINRGPLAMGLLTGKYHGNHSIDNADIRRAGFDWMKYYDNGIPNQSWLDRIQEIRDVLTARSHTLPQGALAWLLARSPNTIPIPGFRTAEQVNENAGVLQLGPLDSSQMTEIDRILGR